MPRGSASLQSESPIHQNDGRLVLAKGSQSQKPEIEKGKCWSKGFLSKKTRDGSNWTTDRDVQVVWSTWEKTDLKSIAQPIPLLPQQIRFPVRRGMWSSKNRISDQDKGFFAQTWVWELPSPMDALSALEIPATSFYKQFSSNTWWTLFREVSCLPEKAMAPHSSTLAWKIPWAEEPGRLQSMGSRRVGQDWATSLSRVGEGNGNPLQCSCLESPRDRGAWWAAIYGVAHSWTWLKWLSSSSKLSTFYYFHIDLWKLQKSGKKIWDLPRRHKSVPCFGLFPSFSFLAFFPQPYFISFLAQGLYPAASLPPSPNHPLHSLYSSSRIPAERRTVCVCVVCVCACVCVCAQLLSHTWLFVASWTIVHQAPLSVEFSGHEYCSGLPFSYSKRFSWCRDGNCLSHLLHWQACLYL